jgi:cytosolic carboxypeptidase protein 5
MENVPQHAVFNFDRVVFSSDFDSGNLANVEQIDPESFNLWTGPDAMGTSGENGCRTWFYFKVTSSTEMRIKLTIKNLNSQGKLFKDGMKPVYKTNETDWERIPGELASSQNNSNFEIAFEHNLTSQETFFAFTYPWTYSQHLNLIEELKIVCQLNSIYFYSENLINSLENRPCHILTISSMLGIQDAQEKTLNNLFPDKKPRCQKFNDKKVVFISCRVHPGEIPSSHVLNGFLKFITSQDQRAVVLRDLFIFKVIPILNPDGVFRGFYRTDTRGVNLNRYYTAPVLSEHPTIYATREVFIYYNTISEIFLYVDLHGHASKKGCFVYGNYLDFKDQIETCLFAKLMQLNCVNFDLNASNFTEANMRASDKRDGLSKEGSGRVALYKQTNLVRCYTLECNYNTGKVLNPISNPEDEITDINSRVYSEGFPKYNIPIYEDVGKAIAVSALDLTGSNPISRLENFQNFKFDVAKYVASMIPFRFDSYIKKACKSLADLDNYFLGKDKEENKKPPRPEKKPLANRNRSDGKRGGSIGKDSNKPDVEIFLPKNSELQVIKEKKESKTRENSLNRDIKNSIKRTSDFKNIAVIQPREILFGEPVKETGSKRGRSMNKHTTRMIISHSSSLNTKRIEI